MQQNVNSPTTKYIPIYELIADFDLNREFLGWTAGDGTSTDGYHAEDYFVDGLYLGADEHGIEPIFETPEDRDRAAEEARESQSGNDWNDRSEEEN